MKVGITEQYLARIMTNHGKMETPQALINTSAQLSLLQRSDRLSVADSKIFSQTLLAAQLRQAAPC